MTQLAALLKIQRAKIDKIDAELISLLASRKEAVEEIAKLKKANSAAIKDPNREMEMQELRARLADQLGINSKDLEPIFTAIINWSVNVQKNS